MLSFFPGQFTRLTPLTTFKELLSEGDLSDIWTSGFTDSEFLHFAFWTLVYWRCFVVAQHPAVYMRYVYVRVSHQRL